MTVNRWSPLDSFRSTTCGLFATVLLIAAASRSAEGAAPTAANPRPAKATKSTSIETLSKPLSPAAALKAFRVPADLAIETVLAEPDVRQPLFIDWDERGRLWVVEYIQYPYPAGLKMYSHDEHWRAVYDKVPQPPPHGVRGLDRISIHEDTDGDGRYDKHTVFLDGLNIATSFALAEDGVWVLNPPYLLFYPDKNHDDVPDGDPVVHLAGFGMEDTHSVANSLRWGPDGWLYAAQGSTVSGHVIRPGLDKQPVHSLGQLVWRYHPRTRRYEIFAEGGGNAFGLEIDSKGRIFSGHNGGDTRGFDYVQGGYYQKGFEKHGPLSNPFAFGYFGPMKHPPVQRFTHTFVIYEDVTLPEAYRGKLFGVEPLQGRVVESQIERNGSSFRTTDLGRPVVTSDPWFRPVNIAVGPDGAIYICDLYEPKISHRDHFGGTISKDTGRIYRLQTQGAKSHPVRNLRKRSTAELIEALGGPNKWTRQMAVRLLGDRHDTAAREPLLHLLERADSQRALEALWALHWLGALDVPTQLACLDHRDPQVRAWTVRLLGDDREVSAAIATKLVDRARHEADVDAVSQLACSARRLPASAALPILKALAARDELAADPHIPLLIWWGIEAKAESDRDAVLALFDNPAFWQHRIVLEVIVERMLRRYAAAGGHANLLSCVRLFHQAPNADAQHALVRGFEDASRGRVLTGLPDELVAILSKAGGNSLPLGIRQGNRDAIDKALQIVAGADVKPQAHAKPMSSAKANQTREQRLQLIEVFGEVKQPRCVPVLLTVAEHDADSDVQAAALAALATYDDSAISAAVIRLYPRLMGDAQSAADTLLTSRKKWAIELFEAVDAGRIDAHRVKPEVARKMTVYRDPRVAQLMARHFPNVKGASTAEMQEQVTRLAAVLKQAEGNDPHKGRRLFAASCAKCHLLFGEGGRIGPDLTTYRRDDWLNLLINIVNPSAEIREGFEQLMVVTHDGRAITGFRFDQDNQILVLRGADGQNVTIPRREIDEIIPQRKSLMPEGLLSGLKDQDIRDLFAYLRASQPLTGKP